jgi:Kdo2-lipid IVA lauroyltransferase/acyltransferase
MRGGARRPWWRRHVLDWVEAAFVYGVAFSFRALPLPVASGLGGLLARTIGPQFRAISGRADINLRRVLPELGPAQRRAVIREMWDNFGRTGVELSQLDRYVRSVGSGILTFEGGEHVEAVQRAGKPVLFVSGHIGNWEVLGLLAEHYGYEMAQLYRPLNNPLIDPLLHRLRVPTRSWLVPKSQVGTRELLQTIRQGKPIGMLVDQRLSQGIEVPFFGLPAFTTPLPAQIAIRYGYALVPVLGLRLGGCRIRAVIEPAIEVPDEGDEAARVRAVTAAMNAVVERWVRAYPGQWLWLHRRWGRG